MFSFFSDKGLPAGFLGCFKLDFSGTGDQCVGEHGRCNISVAGIRISLADEKNKTANIKHNFIYERGVVLNRNNLVSLDDDRLRR